MAFEGDIADYTITPVETPPQSVIRKARELISQRAGWSSRNYREGDAFCILGALRVAHHDNAWQPGTGGAQDYVMRVLRRRGYTGITTFNDHHASHAEALAVLDAAYEAAGKPRGARLDLSGISRKRVPEPAREAVNEVPAEEKTAMDKIIGRIHLVLMLTFYIGLSGLLDSLSSFDRPLAISPFLSVPLMLLSVFGIFGLGRLRDLRDRFEARLALKTD